MVTAASIIVSSGALASGQRHAQLLTAHISDDDYPVAARSKGMAGLTRIAFTVDVDGRVRDCTILSSSGFGLLDDSACAVTTKRFRFRPARNASGALTAERWQQTFVWTLPKHIELIGPGLLDAPPLLPASDGSQPARVIAGSISDDDYPPEAVRARMEGTAMIRYAISATGVPFDCKTVKSSGHAVLDDNTCKIIVDRFRFEPARDAMGKARADTKTQSVTWRMPAMVDPRLAPQSAQFRGEVALDIGADGLVETCTLTVPSGNASVDAQVCATMTKNFAKRVRTDAAGNAIRYRDVIPFWVPREAGARPFDS